MPLELVVLMESGHAAPATASSAAGRQKGTPIERAARNTRPAVDRVLVQPATSPTTIDRIESESLRANAMATGERADQASSREGARTYVRRQ